ncbi:MAG: tRNA uridine-5-carboxymethylaminomethyl(34) synthesis GTPase MnmE [Clostridiales bacterium]|nr:tRNA uridine-5-carboxymethylaminomethyl(34) synthesis GTPase MnmE [Clostridiales bacterium]
MMEENIAAIATPPGKGGVAIIRISGKSPLALAEKMFTPAGKTKVCDFEPYRMYPGQIDGGTFCDYGLCVYFKAPASYTGEDIVEFQCHGGESVARGILKQAFRLGARSAGRGEFTKRAFLNGKLSLASAEGVADMINGESEAEVKAGYLLYSEKLTEKVRALQSELKTLLAGIDVSVDYPEEDIEEQHIEELVIALRKLESELTELTASYGVGKKIKSGVTVAICGKPNTGKSSLLNKLLGYDKAIVSSVAGTTRDAVEGTLEIEGRKFNLYDTAGVRDSGDMIESIGIERAQSIIRSADVAVFVVDSSAKLDEEDARVLQMVQGKPLIKVVNKIDLTQDETLIDADVLTSAVTGEGIAKLMRLMYEKGFGSRAEDAAFLIEERHFNALSRAKDCLHKAIFACGCQPLDLIGIDVKEAWDALGEITGETATEAIIEEIFSKFCVGK